MKFIRNEEQALLILFKPPSHFDITLLAIIIYILNKSQ